MMERIGFGGENNKGHTLYGGGGGAKEMPFEVRRAEG